MKRWVEPLEVDVPPSLQGAVGGHLLVAQTLVRRGVQDVSAARAFLDADQYPSALPGELPGMQSTVERLESAIRAGETICVWGDFDVDGQTATTLLVSALRGLGGEVIYHIPVRASESHGVNLPVLEGFLDQHHLHGAGVLLTCDTGISAHPAVAYAQERGVDVIITDHHDLPPTLPPALALVNPKLLPNGHPMSSLPGVGVAYKLAEALYARSGRAAACQDFLDLAALGIVADLARLTGEARFLLQRGLSVLRLAQRPGLRIFMELAEVNPAWLSEEHISYVLAPRLNSLGRLADANPVVEFLTTPDEGRARLLALEMEALNARRKLLSDQVFQAALGQLENEPGLREQSGLVLSHPAWPAGVIGIVASQLVERFGKPVVLISAPPGELARGSARSVEGVNITAAIAAQAEILAGFGGHPMAAGLSLPAEHIPEFRRRFSQTIREMQGEEVRDAVLQIDGYLPLTDLSLDLVTDLERLAPFGPGNPPLVLATRGLKVTGYASVGHSDEHLLITVEDEDERSQRVIWWQGANLPLPEGRFDLAYSVRASTYRGQRDVQVEWLDARPEGEAVDLGAMSRELQIVDYRDARDPLAALHRLQSEVELLIWCEAEAKRELEGMDRGELAPAHHLALWTTPPGRAELSQALQRVTPRVMYLFAVDPGMDRPEAFLKRLAGLVKHAVEKEQGCASLNRLAAATAQRIAAVQAGLEWLQASGYIRLLRQEGDLAWLARGDGIKTASTAQARGVLMHLLEESAAYRRYFMQAEAHLVVEAAQQVQDT
jgi:single-stranded-DNA-specific exonuclease